MNPRCAEAFAQAGSQDAEQVKEARVRFAQLYKEVTKLEGTKMGDGRWMGVMLLRFLGGILCDGGDIMEGVFWMCWE